MIESGEFNGDFSNIYFFLLAITDRSEQINHYFNDISIFLIVLSKEQLDAWSGTKFDPSKLDLFGSEKNSMSDAAVKWLKHISDV